MALRGNSSQSFLRSKDLLSFSEISYDKEGNYVFDQEILKGVLAKDEKGNLIRNKANIAKILNKYGVLYRMVFNAMNMDQYTYTEVQEALEHLSDYINNLGVSGIVEFHAADKTQNSDHIHFWISSEDAFIYNEIAKEMVSMGYSNEEDVYIQKYEANDRLDEMEYVNSEDRPIHDRFLMKPMGREAGETLHSINKMLLIKDEKKINSLDNQSVSQIFPSLQDKYSSIMDNLNSLFTKGVDNKVLTIEKEIKESQNTNQPFDNSFEYKEKEGFYDHFDSLKNKLITKECTLPKTDETNRILMRIEELRGQKDKK